MCKPRHGVFPTESLVKQVVEREARQPFGSADNLRDFHQMVVNYVGKMVGRELVCGFPQNLVVQGVGLNFHLSAYQVVHLDGLVLRYLEPDGPGICSFYEALDLFRRQGKGVLEAGPAFVVVDERLLCGFCLGPEF